FWIIKIIATTLGETAGDLLSMTMHVGYGVSTLILMSLFLITLYLQLKSKKFNPLLFWTVILTTSTAGTTFSDYMDRTLGLGYAAGSLVLVLGLVVVLTVWRISEKTISVSHISNTRTELFYWVAILFSNTLGTALGDYLADDSGLGFFGGALLIGSIIAIIALLSIYTQVNRILLFWTAFILTRPFGATFGDLLTKPMTLGGLGFGTIGSSMILAISLVMLVAYSNFKLIKVKN
ncbi:MAG: COG4705 family protein, partial [Methylophilus sp.]